MTTRRRIAAILLALVCFMAGRWCGARSEVEIRETVRIDSCFYEKPAPFRVERRPLAVAVPRVIFAPGDSVYKTDLRPVDPAYSDSARLEIAYETREYQDSMYRARVSGPAIGEMHPRLDRLDIYSTERIIQHTVRQRYKWEAGPAAGAWISPAGSGVWVGIGARHNLRRLTIEAAAGYDPFHQHPHIEIGASVAIWQK